MKLFKYFLVALLAFYPFQIEAAGWLPISDAAGSPISQACSTASGTTVTFTAQGVGTANANRISVVSINWSDSTNAGTASISSVTVGGTQSALAAKATAGATNSNSEIWYLNNPTGTTANIVITFTTAVDGVTIAVYNLVGYRSVLASTTGTTSVSQSYNNKQLALEAGSRTTNVSTSLSNITNDFSSSCGSNLWGVHASLALHGNGTLTSTISPTSNNPKIVLVIWSTDPNNPPSILPGLVLWFDSSVFSSLTLSGSLVVNWADLSGKNNHLGDGTTTVKPAYQATGFNNRPTVFFTGSPATAISLTTGTMNMGVGNTLTYFFVGQVQNLGVSGNGRFASYYTGINSDWSDPANWCALRSGASIGTQRDQTASYGATSYATNYIIIGTINSAGLMTTYTNGVTNTPVSTIGGNFVNNGNFALGTSLSDFQYWPGLISEFGASTQFCDSTCVATLYASLKAKWGL